MGKKLIDAGGKIYVYYRIFWQRGILPPGMEQETPGGRAFIFACGLKAIEEGLGMPIR